MYTRECSEYFSAKRKAARLVGAPDRDLPSNSEIHDQLLVLAEMLEGEGRRRELADMRLEALRFLRLLDRFHPRLIGSVLTGHVRQGSDIDLHVFSDHIGPVVEALEDAGHDPDVERKRVVKHNQTREFVHIHFFARFPLELSVYPPDKANYPFKSSITGHAIERTDAAGLEALLHREYPEMDIEGELLRASELLDVWELYASLLKPLESVKQHPKFHPEGDALYHALQVFELARGVRGYDQEFLLAALLHDVGKAIDPLDHVAAGLEALEGAVTRRTAWLIEHHMEAHLARDGTLGARARRRLAASPDFEDLMLLSELDKAGRRGGVAVPTIDEALDIIRQLAGE